MILPVPYMSIEFRAGVITGILFLSNLGWPDQLHILYELQRIPLGDTTVLPWWEGFIKFVHKVGQSFISVCLSSYPSFLHYSFLALYSFLWQILKRLLLWVVLVYTAKFWGFNNISYTSLFLYNDKDLWKSVVSQFSMCFQKELLLAISFQKIVILRLWRLHSDITKLWVRFWKQDLWFEVEQNKNTKFWEPCFHWLLSV